MVHEHTGSAAPEYISRAARFMAGIYWAETVSVPT
jgi:hypothetical protein